MTALLSIAAILYDACKTQDRGIKPGYNKRRLTRYSGTRTESTISRKAASVVSDFF